ncbi:N-lysine methyltransferase KMT5A-like [Haliotis rufescens]|uniref:N-lysine methyltransferase KMT5A-like n=1 Tax=Haliotis rufescens TaxID=6454 RepID=UPI00201F87B0|nr:N-lysine methyltransferase KMT5A-like [Haliotis rufescens]
MYRLCILVTASFTIWNKDECMALTVAEHTRQQIKEARAAIRRSDMSPSYLRITHLGQPIGRGIVADKDFGPGDYITYYHGKYCVEKPIIDEYTFELPCDGRTFWIDASQDDGSYGRLLNDEWRFPNAMARLIFVDGRPHVAYFAHRFIKTGQEIRFNYNYNSDFPWRQASKVQTNLCFQRTWLDLLQTTFLPVCKMDKEL